MKKPLFLPMLEVNDPIGAGGVPANNDPEKTTISGGANDPTNGGAEKTFTQEDLNRIAAQEKRQGVASVLKALGFEKEDDAKAFVEKYREVEDNKKDDLTKVQEQLETEKKAKEEAERKADLIEKKLKVASLGVAADKIEDVVTLALAKVTDSKDFETALEDLKTSYSMLFEGGASAGSHGTGGTGNPPRSGKSGIEGGIGKRLAEQKKQSYAQTNKQSYFSN